MLFRARQVLASLLQPCLAFAAPLTFDTARERPPSFEPPAAVTPATVVPTVAQGAGAGN